MYIYYKVGGTRYFLCVSQNFSAHNSSSSSDHIETSFQLAVRLKTETSFHHEDCAGFGVVFSDARGCQATTRYGDSHKIHATRLENGTINSNIADVDDMIVYPDADIDDVIVYPEPDPDSGIIYPDLYTDD